MLHQSSESTTIEQKQYLNFIAESHIDQLFKSCKNYQDVIFCLRLAFKGSCESNEDGIIKRFKLRQIPEGEFDNIVTLSKILFGLARIENNLIVFGSLPSLDDVRAIISDLSVAKMLANYSTHADKEKFLMCLGVYLLRYPADTSPYEDHAKLLLAGLQEVIYSPDDQNRIRMEAGVLYALKSMDIIRNNGLCDLVRLKLLAETLNSPFIKKYHRLWSENDKWHSHNLRIALTMDSPIVVRLALQKIEDVNKVVEGDLRTPVMFAVMQCSLDTLKTVLEFKPDVNARRAGSHTNVLYESINKQDQAKTSALIEAGVKLHNWCYATVVPFNQKEATIKGIKPSLHALNIYKQNKTDAALAVVRVLANAGAYINEDLTAIPKNVCEDIFTSPYLMLDTKLPADTNCKAILNIDSLIAFLPSCHVDELKKLRRVLSDYIKSTGSVPKSIRVAYAHVDIAYHMATRLSVNAAFSIVQDSLREKDYQMAFLRACSIRSHDNAFSMVSLMLKHKQALDIEVAKPSPYTGRTGLFYADKRGHDKVKQVLEQVVNNKVENRRAK